MLVVIEDDHGSNVGLAKAGGEDNSTVCKKGLLDHFDLVLSETAELHQANLVGLVRVGLARGETTVDLSTYSVLLQTG